MTNYTMTAELVDEEQNVLWQVERRASNSPPIFTITERNANLQQELTRQGNEGLTDSVRAFFTELPIPETVYYQPVVSDGTVAGLGSDRIGPGATPAAVAGAGSTPSTMQRGTPAPGQPGAVPPGATPPGTTPPGVTPPGTRPPGFPGSGAAGLQGQPISEADFLKKCRELVDSTYGELLAADASELEERLKWSPGLKRAVSGLRWGLGVQFARKPDSAVVRVQPKSQQMLTKLGQATAGAGPMLVERVEGLMNSGAFGSWLDSGDPRARGTVLLGAGSLSDLLAAARKARLDFTVITYFGVSRRGRSRDSTMEFRLFDVATGDRLFVSETLTAGDLQDTGADVAAEVAQSVAEKIREQLALQPAEDIPREAVSGRLEYLRDSPPVSPLAALTEIRLYHARQLTDETTALRAATTITDSQEDARTILTGPSPARAEIIKTLRNRGSAPQ